MSSILFSSSVKSFASEGQKILITTNGTIDDKAIRVGRVFELIRELSPADQETVLNVKINDGTSFQLIKSYLENPTEDNLCIQKIYLPALHILRIILPYQPLDSIAE